MKIIFWGKGNRGVSCLKSLWDSDFKIDLVVTHPEERDGRPPSLSEIARERGIETIAPDNPNDQNVEELLSGLEPDLFVLAGYGKIIRPNIIKIPKMMCINLHGGKLPKYRGSSPLNWALINGEKTFGLSIIRLDSGVDTGEILLEREFNISVDDTIKDLHRIANEQFPAMLLEALVEIKEGTYTLKTQHHSEGSYFPLRFPEDGLILWDNLTAEQVHNRIRALTEPYPCAFTYFKKRMVKLRSSELHEYNYFGEPGRIYMKSKKGLLVCASDKCLWIRDSIFEDGSEAVFDAVQRYDSFRTLRESVLLNQDYWSQK